MPSYSFEAKSFDGRIKRGKIEAVDSSELAKILRREGLILVRFKEEKPRKFIFPLLKRVSLSEKIFFTKNLGVMISAGVPIIQALWTLSQQTNNRFFKKTILEIRDMVTKGESFSNSLLYFPSIFPSLYQNIIKAGEESGKLEESLRSLSYYMEREYELRNKIRGAMIYPLILISAMLGIGILMLVLVVPKLAETFKELEIQLPLTTRIVIGLGTIVAKYWAFLFLGVLLFFVLFFQLLKRRPIKKIFDNILLRLPAISNIVKKNNSALLSRTLASLLSAGLDLPLALEITAHTVGNLQYQELLLTSAERVRKGEKLSEILKSAPKIIPFTISSMVEVGEMTGETSTILEKIANFYDDEVTQLMKNISSIIEPVMLLLIGGAIGFFAISMVQPMYSMLQAIK